MTLVVARITDLREGRVSLLADTMIYHANGNETANRQKLSRPGQKVVILNDDVVVAFAGDNPDSGVREAVRVRERRGSRTEVLDHLTRFTDELASVSRCYLVVERRPEPRIWQIVNGRCEERTSVRQAFVGDEKAYDRYRARTQRWDDDSTTDEFRLVGSMQSVITMDDLPTVGGFVVRVTGSRVDPFRFRGDPGLIGPWFTEAAVRRYADRIVMRFTTPEGGDPTVHARLDVAGRGSTFSALVHVIPQSVTAWMHTHEEPWGDAIRLSVASPQALVAAAARYGQELQMPEGAAAHVLNGGVPL
nr:hypothetical protein [Rhodococcus wratislaviensis]GLK40765.1 hypothetical protein GCM10017611_76400 [Rhodococcus wratislaviensis]